LDPNACWKRLIDALMEGDGGEAGDAAVDLGQWIINEGFKPEGLIRADECLSYLPGKREA
jgi:hypothetical protein